MPTAIQTKFLPATNVKGSRYKAWGERGSVTLSADHSLDSEKNHHRVALALLKKLKRGGEFVAGGLPGGGNCYVQTKHLGDRVYVLDWSRKFTTSTDGLHTLREDAAL